MSRVQAGGHFIRSGFSALFLGFVMSVGMVVHYVVGSQYPTGHDFMSNITLGGRVRGHCRRLSCSAARCA